MNHFEQTIRKVLVEVLDQYFSKSTKWVEKEKAKSLLGIKSDTTLQELRDSNAIRFSKHGRKILYDTSSIEQYLEQFTNYDK